MQTMWRHYRVRFGAWLPNLLLWLLFSWWWAWLSQAMRTITEWLHWFKWIPIWQSRKKPLTCALIGNTSFFKKGHSERLNSECPFKNGATNGNRTRTVLGPRDFKSDHLFRICWIHFEYKSMDLSYFSLVFLKYLYYFINNCLKFSTFWIAFSELSA